MYTKLNSNVYTGLKRFWKEQNGLVLIVLAGLVILILTPVYFWRYQDQMHSDFGLHLIFTRRMIQGNFAEIPAYSLAHSGLQLLVAAIYWLSFRKIPLVWINVFLLVGAQVLTAAGFYIWLGKVEFRFWDWLRAAAALCLTIAAPVMALAGLDGLYYFGYIGLASYHNPTVILLRPLALFSFGMLVHEMEGHTRAGWGAILLSCLLVAFSGLVKPSYILCLLPIAFVLAAWRWWLHRPIDLRFLVFGVFVPGFGVLAVQGLMTYLLPSSGGSRLTLAPFLVVSGYSDYLGLKLILSLLFPLAVILFSWRTFLKDSVIQMVVLAFGFGLAQAYLLTETGDRMMDGNFLWGPQIMLFLIFATFCRKWLQDRFLSAGLWEKGVVIGTWLLHAAAGVVYIVYVLTNIPYR